MAVTRARAVSIGIDVGDLSEREARRKKRGKKKKKKKKGRRGRTVTSLEGNSVDVARARELWSKTFADRFYRLAVESSCDRPEIKLRRLKLAVNLAAKLDGLVKSVG